ncbi:MAG: hypothetical protein J6A94_06475 [Lachnospiraceae bacterium]|nr:hypothetical protein [Lachnospiraceae bacterium]
MLPKEYFELNFKNGENIGNKDSINEPLINGLNLNFQMDMDNKYSNNMEFEILINECLKNNIYFSGSNIFIGKLVNSYPNCYNVNDDILEGCLICITSGLTENSYVLAKYYALNYLMDFQLFNNEQYKIYKVILKNDLIRRIHTGYGSQIEPGDTLYYAELVLNKLGIYDLLQKAADFSVVMDLFIIYHEYSHYIIRTFSNNSNEKENRLMLQTAIIYSHLCIDYPIYCEMPKEEVLADLAALILFFNSGDLGITDIMALLLSIVQLQKMSLTDTYTNKYRIDLLYYFLSLHSNTFSANEQELKNRVNEIVAIFNQASGPAVIEKIEQESWDMLQKLIAITENPEAIFDILNDRLKTLQMMADGLSKININDEYEKFS